MYKVNERWNKFVLGVINNIGWIIVITMTLMTLLFTQLGTWHRETGSIHSLIDSYYEYGNIHHVVPIGLDNIPIEEQITITEYYENLITQASDRIEALELELQDTIKYPLNSVSRGAKLNEINRHEESIAKFQNELNIIISGKLLGINEFSPIKAASQEFNWVGEYTYDKIFYLVVTDFYSWTMALMLSFSAIVIKIQGNKTGRNSGIKTIWKIVLRHATLSEKIAPRAKDAEKICQEMNRDELRLKREDKLRYVALKYEDVFREDGTFLNNPNFVGVDVDEIKTLRGKSKYVENPYQKKLLKKQKRVVERLKKYRIKEVHTYILLESKAEARERFDFGESIKKRDRKTTLTNIVTSLVTVLPMFGAASLFVITENKTNLIIGILGMILNFVSLLSNMIGSYDYIINSWGPGILKKCDTLLVIGNQLSLTDEKDNNWDATIEKEMNQTKK